MADEVKDKKASLVQPVKLGSKLNAFHQQVAAGAKVAATPSGVSSGGFADMSTTVIFPDCSGSMDDIVGGGEYGSKNEPKAKIAFCRDAVASFIDNCFAGATKVGVASFPEQVVVEPTANLAMVKTACEALHSTGSTPMAEPLDYVIQEWPGVSHGIVISDGAPDDKNAVMAAVTAYKEKKIKLDAVHIGDKDESGESLMKNIAELTGGVYIKFTDVANFAKNFKFLTPRYRLQLTTSKNPVALLGAAEVKL